MNVIPEGVPREYYGYFRALVELIGNRNTSAACSPTGLIDHNEQTFYGLIPTDPDLSWEDLSVTLLIASEPHAEIPPGFIEVVAKWARHH